MRYLLRDFFPIHRRPSWSTGNWDGGNGSGSTLGVYMEFFFYEWDWYWTVVHLKLRCRAPITINETKLWNHSKICEHWPISAYRTLIPPRVLLTMESASVVTSFPIQRFSMLYGKPVTLVLTWHGAHTEGSCEINNSLTVSYQMDRCTGLL